MQTRILISKKHILKSQKGTISIIFIVSFTAVIALLALALDIGALVFEKSKLSAGVDAAALAGIQEMIVNSDNINSIVENYALKNCGELKQLDIHTNIDEKTIEVTGIKTIENTFAKFFNRDKQDILATSRAKIENIKSLSGVRPLGVVKQTFSYGALYTLKEGAGDGITGNYGALSLGGTGASKYGENLLNGYMGTVSVGDIILTETGNVSGTTQTSINTLIDQCTHVPACTYQYYNKNCPRIIFIPVIETLEVEGRKNIKVVGFGTFFLEGVTVTSGKADVIGRFITYAATGETSNEVNDFGTYGIRLIK